MAKVLDSCDIFTNFNGMTLGEVQNVLGSMIKDFGLDAKIDLDACHNNVKMIVHYERDETPEEMAAREAIAAKKREKERSDLLKRKKAIEKKLADLNLEI